MIYYLALFFILYEASKILFYPQFKKVIDKTISLNKDLDEIDVSLNNILNADQVILFIIESIYIVFTITLLFSVYWGIGLFIIALSLLTHGQRNKKSVFITDSLLTILVLSLILIV